MVNFTPVASIYSGLIIGTCVLSFRLLLGRVLGISGIFSQVLKLTRDAWRFTFVLGLIISGLLVKSYPINIESHRNFIIGGFLVGLGTRLGCGCTSGHGLVGLSRCSKRSLLATPMFVFSGMIVRTLMLDSNYTLEFSMDWSFAPWIPGLLASTVALVSSCYYAGSWLKNSKQIDVLEPLITGILGILFGASLITGGMTNTTKVLDFLSMPTIFFNRPSEAYPRFDPSLALILAGGLVPNLILNSWMDSHKEPILAKKWSLPTRNDIDWKLLVGSSVFGIGWGLAGICPGPGIVLMSRIFYGEYDILKWMLAYYTGDYLAGAL